MVVHLAHSEWAAARDLIEVTRDVRAELAALRESIDRLTAAIAALPSAAPTPPPPA